MGGKQSKTVNVDTSQTVTKMVTQMATASGSAKASATGIQTGNIVLGTTAHVLKDVILKQTIDLTQVVYSKLTSQQAQDLTDAMFTQLKADIAQKSSVATPSIAESLASVTPFGAATAAVGTIAGSTVSSNDMTIINNALKSIQSSTQGSNLYSSVDAQVFSSQTGTLTINGQVDGNVILDQNIIIKQTATLMIDQIFNQINNSNLMSNNDIKIVQSTSKGGDNTLSNIIMLIICVILLCCCCSVSLFAIKMAGETAQTMPMPPP